MYHSPIIESHSTFAVITPRDLAPRPRSSSFTILRSACSDDVDTYRRAGDGDGGELLDQHSVDSMVDDDVESPLGAG